MSSNKKRKRSSMEFIPLKSFKPITNEKQARRVTSEFHHRKDIETSAHSKYQAASALLTNLHKTSSKFVFRMITKLGLRPKSGEKRLDTFEIGAINLQLVSSPFLKVDAIDLKSRHPSIKEVDFFKVEPEEKYDVVVLAMVLNCVINEEKRGEMLVRCRKFLREKGLFFLVLPTRCLSESSWDKFENDIMIKIGFEPIEKEFTSKVVFMCFRAIPAVEMNEKSKPLKYIDDNKLFQIKVLPF